MSVFEESRELSRKNEALKQISNICINFYPLVINKTFNQIPSGLEFNKLSIHVEKYLSFLEEDMQEDIKNSIEIYIKEIEPIELPIYEVYKKVKPYINIMKNKIDDYYQNIKAKLADIPGSIEKIKGCLMGRLDLGEFEFAEDFEASCILKDIVSENTINSEVAHWKDEIRRNENSGLKAATHFKEQTNTQTSVAEIKQNLFNSIIFWNSADFNEDSDHIARYRFLETFSIGEFPEIKAEIEIYFKAALFCEPDDIKIRPLAIILWEISRSNELSLKLQHAINDALLCICNNQNIEGWWSDWNSRNEPNIFLTAICSNVLLKLSKSNTQRELAKKSILWLSNQQKPGGCWKEATGDPEEKKSEVFTTLLALESIKLTRLDGYYRTINSGEEWLKSQLDLPEGPNLYLGFSRFFIKVLLVEYFKDFLKYDIKSFRYLPMVKAFINHSQYLSTQDNQEFHKMATVLTFNAVEMFLYECLSHQSINVSIFDKGNTIGMSRALIKLQNYFQNNKINDLKYLQQGQLIEFKNSLDQLKVNRDNIVHKGSSIGKEDAIKSIGDSISFINLQSYRIFNFEIF
ncbi:MAG: hypothetical protein K8T10_08245 [Candidatus Eremiobacteraeota bacterium]|nr:hypothetical protein [Candidatus Eremiobacteraeota bacterium]